MPAGTLRANYRLQYASNGGTVLSSALPLGVALWLGNAMESGLVLAVGWSLLLWVVWCTLLLGFRLVAWSEVRRLLPGGNRFSKKDDLPG